MNAQSIIAARKMKRLRIQGIFVNNINRYCQLGRWIAAMENAKARYFNRDDKVSTEKVMEILEHHRLSCMIDTPYEYVSTGDYLTYNISRHASVIDRCITWADAKYVGRYENVRKLQSRLSETNSRLARVYYLMYSRWYVDDEEGNDDDEDDMPF